MQQKWLETGLRRSPLGIVCRTKSKTIKRIEVVTKRNKERCTTEESKKNQYMTCRVDKKKEKDYSTQDSQVVTNLTTN